VVSLDAGGEVEAAASVDVDGTGASVPDVPPWADRPTAGFPTVPVAVGLHPTWVAASPAPVVAPRRIDETSTVDAIGSAFADRPVTHSRATFGRMRRRVTHVAVDADAAERLQQTPTAGSSKTTERE
jgi:hypothetical protein